VWRQRRTVTPAEAQWVPDADDVELHIRIHPYRELYRHVLRFIDEFDGLARDGPPAAMRGPASPAHSRRRSQRGSTGGPGTGD
jgi:hypothetical protein